MILWTQWKPQTSSRFCNNIWVLVILLIIIICESGLKYSFCFFLDLIYVFFKTVTILLQYVTCHVLQTTLSISCSSSIRSYSERKYFFKKIRFYVKTEVFQFWDLSTLPYFRHPRLQALVNLCLRFLYNQLQSLGDMCFNVCMVHCITNSFTLVQYIGVNILLTIYNTSVISSSESTCEVK